MALIVKWDKHGRVCLVGMSAEACWQLHSATDWLTRTKTAEPWSLTKEYFWTEQNKSQSLVMIHLSNPGMPTTIYIFFYLNAKIIIKIFSYTLTYKITIKADLHALMYMYCCFVVVCNWSIEKGKDTWNLTDRCEATFTKNSALPQISSQDQLLWRQVVRFNCTRLLGDMTKSWAGPLFSCCRSPWQFWTTAATNKLLFLLSYPRCKVNIFHSTANHNIHSFIWPVESLTLTEGRIKTAELSRSQSD